MPGSRLRAFVISTGCAWFSPPSVSPGKPAKALSRRTAFLLMTNLTGTAGKPGAAMKVVAGLSQFVSVTVMVIERSSMIVKFGVGNICEKLLH